MNSNLADSDVRGHPGEPPFFSVAVPCCDVAPYLDECLASLLAQPFPDWECLLYVEESRDGTLGIAKKHAMGDPRFRVFEGPRTGSCSVPRNRCVEEAHGEYVVFLDGDDSLVPGALARLADAIASRPGADIYPCAVQVHDDRTGLDTELRDNYPPD
ncbi:MAG: glycosyltransferase family 2 protein, partial [Kiritimatiellae bacterium]|nr:glycosyltransferase family 2 protein [Kiritimatiellia bacterium]